MPENPRHHWFYPWVPIGLAAALGTLVVWLLLLSPGGPQAQAGEPRLESAAGRQTTGQKLLVSVTLVTAEASGRLKGDLVAELVGPGDKVVASLEKAVDQRDQAEAYRFEFANPKLPIDQVKVRYTFGKQQLEKPLGKILLAKAHGTAPTDGQESTHAPQ